MVVLVLADVIIIIVLLFDTIRRQGITDVVSYYVD